jgi:hypothetical protein
VVFVVPIVVIGPIPQASGRSAVELVERPRGARREGSGRERGAAVPLDDPPTLELVAELERDPPAREPGGDHVELEAGGGSPARNSGGIIRRVELEV